MRDMMRVIVGVITELYLDGQVAAIATRRDMALVAVIFCLTVCILQRLPKRIVQDAADLRSSIATIGIREYR
jgi:hypothetical protein